MIANQRVKPNSYYESSESTDSGILNESLLLLLFEYIAWDLQTLCQVSAVSKKLRAVAKRLLWRELCVHRAPRMVATLADGGLNGRLGVGWNALGKLLFYCCGCESSQNFKLGRPLSGHPVKATRFSKTSGRSFLAKKCRDDLLYVCDPCEHRVADREDDLGVYRGIFRGFMKSRTRDCLIRLQVPLEEQVRCPYCAARVWSMTNARLVPQSAARRLGSHDGRLEYFVCVNGHLHGSCWLAPLSSDEDLCHDYDEDEDDDGYGGFHGVVGNGRTTTCSGSSGGEEVVAGG